MAEEGAMPQRPAGVQPPGVPGAGNILDPAVRAELREELHPALHEAAQKARGQQDDQDVQAEEPASVAAPASAPFRAGPYPHGDVELRGFVANVPPGPVRIHRGRAARRFYFLKEQPEPPNDAAPARTPPPGPKPG